jgi:hypothetical protein
MGRAFLNAGLLTERISDMKRFSILLAAAVAVTGACSRASDKSAVDSALSVGATTTPLDSISAAEQVQPNALAPAPVATTTAPRRTSSGGAAPVHRSSSGSSGSYGSSGSSASGGSVSSAPASSRTVTVKHTKRDAEIGAAAGAIIGATTSHNKIGGAVVGGVVGGVLGGVIGNNVDKTKKKQ